MSPWVFLAVALAGGVGSALRFVLDTATARLLGTAHPWGTLAINLSGSFLLGLVTGLGTAGGWDPRWTLVLGTGLLGGYTTFSTASLETVRLARRRRWGPALGHGVGMAVGSVALAALGHLIGSSR